MNKDEVIAGLGVSCNDRSERANQELGKRIAAARDAEAVAALVELCSDTSPSLASDAIKALYECGYEAPELLTPHVEPIAALLDSSANRIVWGAMIALSCIAADAPKNAARYRDAVCSAVDSGSVITRDAGIKTLVRIAAAIPKQRSALAGFLMDFLQNARDKDFPKYFEWTVPVLWQEHAAALHKQAEARMPSVGASGKKRIEKTLAAQQ